MSDPATARGPWTTARVAIGLGFVGSTLGLALFFPGPALILLFVGIHLGTHLVNRSSYPAPGARRWPSPPRVTIWQIMAGSAVVAVFATIVRATSPRLIEELRKQSGGTLGLIRATTVIVLLATISAGIAIFLGRWLFKLSRMGRTEASFEEPARLQEKHPELSEGPMTDAARDPEAEFVADRPTRPEEP